MLGTVDHILIRNCGALCSFGFVVAAQKRLTWDHEACEADPACLSSGPWMFSPGFQLVQHMRYVTELCLSKPCIKMAALVVIDQSPGLVLRGALCV